MMPETKFSQHINHCNQIIAREGCANTPQYAAENVKTMLQEVLDEERKRVGFWEDRAREHASASDYYREELAKAHALLGRVLQQVSERWGSVNLTSYFPTSNLTRKRSVSNPTGEKR